MGLSKKQQQNADRLKTALDKRDQEDAAARALAEEMGAAARAGDEEKVAKLAAEAKKKGWV